MAEVEYEGLSELGRSLKDLRKNVKSPVENILAAFVNDAIEGMRSNLAKKGIDSGSNLSQSMKPAGIEVTDDAIIASIELADYWDYVNQGVDGLGTKWGSEYLFRPTAQTPTPSGQKNFVQSLADWVFKKGINTFSFKTASGEYVTKPIQDEDDRMKAAFGIMVGIKRNGIKPTHFFDDYFTDNKLDEINDELFEQIAKMIK